MTDQECTVDRTLSPLQPLDAGLLGVCVCLSVLECVNALLRLPEFICLVSSGATPFYSFHAKVSPRRPPLLSCLLFCLSLSVRFRLFGQKDEQKQSLSHRKSAAWAQGACRHIVELDAASHAEFICFTDVARMHTQSELPCSLSQWWCICSHGACVHMLERTGRLTSTLLRVLSQQLLLRVQGWEVRGHYLLCAFGFISMDNLHSHMSLRHGDGPTREGRRRMVLLVKPATFYQEVREFRSTV